MSKKTSTKLGTECFYCFKQGFCQKTIIFEKHHARKPLHFCGQTCADAFIQDELTPANLAANRSSLVTITRLLEESKSDPDLFVFKKSMTIEKMLRTSLNARKPKAELERLFALWKECVTKTLSNLSDDKELEEATILLWADGMKKDDKIFQALILSLGR